jgi:glycosyltransferase involved in cell wall biosynthesis
MKKILILTDWFYPGFKAGGLISTCYNLSMLLREEYDIHILTTDRDLGDQEPYKNIVPDQWTSFSENIRVYYTSPQKLTLPGLIAQIRRVRPDHIYLNSMFSLPFTIYPLLLKRLGMINAHIIVSPGGMLKESALNIKRLKKKCFLTALRLLRIQQLIRFHATDNQEQQDVKKVFGKKAVVSQIYCAPPVPATGIACPPKQRGAVKLVFVGRIHPIKNLHFLIECLQHSYQKIELTVVGPIENTSYFNQCKELEHYLPGNIKLNFAGAVTKEKINYYLNDSHFLALPSAGENFGYAIVEAFCAGKPVIITDQTPWRSLTQQKIGWDLPVNNQASFIEAINEAAEMDQQEYNTWSKAAWNFARYLQENYGYKEKYVNMFNSFQ